MVTPPRGRPRQVGAYVPRRLYLAGIRPPRTDTGELDVPGAPNAPPKMQICFSNVPGSTTDAWRAALLFRLSPGFFQTGEEARVSLGVLENVFRFAIEKRFATLKTQRKVASFVSAFVASDACERLPFAGESAVFAITSFLKSLSSRG